VSKAEILLVEDDQDLAEGLGDALAIEGYSVQRAGDGPAGLREMRAGAFDLVILDVMLPNLSGFDVLKELRARGDQTPVLILTARSAEVDKVRGLKIGADDYVTKPFGIMELVARIEAILKRTRVAEPLTRVNVGEVVVDFRARKAWRRESPVALTSREFEILGLLARNRGAAVSRSELIARIWGMDDDVEVSTRTVDQHVLSLRRKLGDRGESPRLIETVYGYGYRLV
jgi:two-component system alkaline phosphatase synthesis response regulator PhoP